MFNFKKNTSTETSLQLFADYHQFYIQDEKVDGDLSDSWTEAANKILLATSKGTVGIGTARNMDVPVMIKILSDKPDLELEKYDQINECSLEINSGKLVAAGCTDYFPEAKRIKLKNGWYRVRVCYGNLTKISEDGLDGEDFYDLYLWKEKSETPLEVIKQRT